MLEVPQGLIRHNETLKLTAQIEDSDGAVGLFDRQIKVMADQIKPEPLIKRPGAGFGAPEDSDFTVAFQAYDNVKVNRLTLSRAYGVLKNDGTYVKQNFTLVRSIDGIPADDYEPVTTLNIDTPEYNQLMHVDRLFAILQGFGLASSDVKRVDVLLRVEAFDAANSQAYEVGYPVRVDERPTLDVAEPAPGAKVVEGNPLYVNVKAFDDVGIEYVNIIATYGNGQTPYIQRLRTSPYNFCLLYTSPSPRDRQKSRMPSSA